MDIAVSKVSYKNIFAVAFPIILSSLAQNIVAITDTMFLGHFGEIELAAAALSAVFYQVLLMFIMGFSVGTQILIANSLGKGIEKTVGNIIFHCFIFMIFSAIVLIGGFKIFGSDILSGIIKSSDIKQAVDNFLHIRIYGLSFAFLNLCFNAFYVGIGKTRAISYSTIVLAAVNIVLDYLFIYDRLNLSINGMKGAALASVIAEVCGLLVFLFLSLRKKEYKIKYRLFKAFPLRKKTYFRLLNISYPLMFEYLIAMGNFFIFFLMIERLGQTELALANIIRSLYVIFMLPIWGFTATVSANTAYLCGCKREDLIPRLLRRSVVLSFCFISLIVIAFICFRIPITSLFTKNEELISLVWTPSLVIIIASYFMAWSQVIFSSIIGRGLTAIGFILEFVDLIVYVAYSYYVIICLRLSVAAAFTAEWVYTIFLGLISMVFLHFYKKTKRKANAFA